MTALLEARGVSMQFPGVRALDGVDFDVRPGEVHALIGENGAGKSTLVKILSGEISGYAGEVRVDGVSRRFATPREAIEAGIAVIPQELELVSTLSAADNVYLGREPLTRMRLVDRAALERGAAAELAAVGQFRPPDREPLSRLGPGEQQLVAIARALSQNARLLVMDEPTASLGEAEAERLEKLVAALCERGVAIVYISHKLEEVRRLADRITVLRDGRRITTVQASELDVAGMVKAMVGRAIERVPLDPVAVDAPELLHVENLSLPDPLRPGEYRLHGVSLSVRRGEIVGLAGLVGAGRTDFLLALAGSLEGPGPLEGSIRVAEREYRPASPIAAQDAGVVLLPEERKAQAIFPHLSVGRNITVSALRRVATAGWIDRSRERAAASELMRATGVRAASAAVPIATLSGGNQQKAVLARCLFAAPKVLLLDEPTRGIDLAAKAEIYALLRRLAAEGFAIVLCSSEMSEVLTQCHRIVVFRDGRVAAEFSAADATEENVLEAAAGAGDDPRDSSDVRKSGGPPPRGGSSGPPGAGRIRSFFSRFASVLGLAAVLLLALVFSPVRGGRPVFLGIGNLTDILRQVSEKGILAVGMTAVVITAGIDLSVGSVLALSATLSAYLWMHGYGFASTVAIVLLAGAICGALNGLVVARWRLQAFIATLATMSAARGVARYVSGGSAIPLGFGPGGAPAAVRSLGSVVLPYVPVPAVLFLASVLAMSFLLTRTRTGRYLYAIGDNPTAARLSGVRIRWNTALVYILSGAAAALAGIVHCAQLEQGNPNDGVAYELDAIAAVVIGGTSLAGGVGTVGGTLVGVLTIGVINNIMGLNNVDANLQLILKGAIILGAVWLQRKRR